MNVNKYKKQYWVLFIPTLFILILVISIMLIKVSNKKEPIIVDILVYQDIGTDTPEMSENVKSYSAYSANGTQTYGASSQTDFYIEQEFDASSESKFTENVNTSPNDQLYQLCDSYFTVYYGSNRISPILPMAIANVETPGRANNKVTWSSLFPSAVIPVDKIYSSDVTTVIEDSIYFATLGHEYSTRDRGPLQMSPTYGTNNKELNMLMSGTEVQKLKKVDVSGYSGWASNASNYPGDRFYIPDICLRMSASMQSQIDNMQKNGYIPNNDMQIIAQCAMGHHNSGIWYFSNHNKKVGKWNSAELAYTYASRISEQQFIDVLSEYAKEHDECYINSTVAKKLYYENFEEPMSTYCTADIVCTYPIKAMYAYIKLCMLYTS